ncbi:hypothetical protein [Serratia fonticola]
MKNIVENQGIKNDKPVPLSYEQLKQRLDAVVAECVLAKAEVVCWAKECDRIVYRHTNQITDMHQLEAVKDLANLTPTVTAALAEVEAKAIERFIAKKLKQLEAMHPDTHAFGATAMSIRAQINELQAYVVELREVRG